jgi:BirA family biotin operon repressor/biotin-[acetyl-CoA-carboxylase] ligase
VIKDQGGRPVNLPPFFTLHAFDSIGSTNEEARALADKGAVEGQLVWARSQNQGVGRRGRGWSSPEGNLYCSLMLRPNCSVQEGAKLSFLIALALYRSAKDVLPDHADLSLKWPNDLLIDRHKVAGILLESKSASDGNLEWLVVGTGVNIAFFPEHTDGLPATSFEKQGSDCSVEQVLELYAAHFLDLYRVWQKDGFEPIRREWLQYASGMKKKITVRLPNETFNGTFIDLDTAGALVLQLEDGSQRMVTAGEVFFLPND